MNRRSATGNRLCAWLAASMLAACGGSDAPMMVESDPRWTAGVPLPLGLTGVAAAAFQEAIYVAGGDAAQGPSLRVYRFRPGATAWERLADLPAARASARLVVADGTLYLLGGMLLLSGNTYYPDRSVYSYQPASDRWIARASFPDLRDGDAVGVPGGIVVVGGGFGDAEHGGTFPGDSAVVYHADTDSWQYAAPLRTPRHTPLAVATGSLVYVFGGRNLDGIGTPRDIEIYDAAGNTWRSSGQFVDYGQITGQAHTRVGNAVHFLGGVYALPGSPVIETHFRYDLTSEQWQALPELPTPRAHAAAVALDGRIYVLGGLRGPRFLAESFTPVVEVYDVR